MPSFVGMVTYGAIAAVSDLVTLDSLTFGEPENRGPQFYGFLARFLVRNVDESIILFD